MTSFFCLPAWQGSSEKRFTLNGNKNSVFREYRCSPTEFLVFLALWS